MLGAALWLAPAFLGDHGWFPETALAIMALLALWPGTRATPARTIAAILLVMSQWTYIAGEVLSNTITIGEPPGDVGGLLEIASGAISGTGLLGLAYLVIRQGRRHRSTTAITIVAAILAAATVWWFVHPIDQSTPGAPPCAPGNPLYNLTHATNC